MEELLIPPVAFAIYLGLVGLLSYIGRNLAGTGHATSSLKSSIYSGGEKPPERLAAPGYRPFFVIALFFAILHLGVLILGSGGLTEIAGVYLVGLIIALLTLIVG